MKFATSLLMGSAAALAVVAGTEAADLPTRKDAPAADYVKVCKNGDIAGFAIPGSDACLTIGGAVSAEIAAGKFAGADWASAGEPRTAARRADDIGYGARGQLDFDALTNTAQGPLIAHVELRANAGDRSFDWTQGAATVNAAYAQWAGFTFGKRPSFYWPAP